MLTTATLRRVFVSAFLPLLLLASEASAAHCKKVRGEFFSSMFSDASCQSPVLICTDGTLMGKLIGDYLFTMETLYPVDPANDPSVFHYTGHSVITLAKNHPPQIFGTDDGILHYNPAGQSPFAATVTFTGGTDKYEGASGHLNIVGQTTFADGTSSGTYSGELCRPDGNDDNDDHDGND